MALTIEIGGQAIFRCWRRRAPPMSQSDCERKGGGATRAIAAGSDGNPGSGADASSRFLLFDRLHEDVGDAAQGAGGDRLWDEQRRGLVRRIDAEPGGRRGAALVCGEVLSGDDP